MRTSLNEIQEIEEFLLHKKDSIDLKNQRLLNAEVYEKIEIQKYLYSVIHQMGRNVVLESIKEAEEAFFKTPRFQPIIRSINQLFNKKS